MLLTRPPLYRPPEGEFLVRLACVRHAASVRSEPGSNSPVEELPPDMNARLTFQVWYTGLEQAEVGTNYSVFKERETTLHVL